jgi:hypothetical protein
MYKAKGLDVSFLPPTPEGGEEPELVVKRQREMDADITFPNNTVSRFKLARTPSTLPLCTGRPACTSNEYME